MTDQPASPASRDYIAEMGCKCAGIRALGLKGLCLTCRMSSPVLHEISIAVERQRAADAAEIARLKARNEFLEGQITLAVREASDHQRVMLEQAALLAAIRQQLTLLGIVLPLTTRRRGLPPDDPAYLCIGCNRLRPGRFSMGRSIHSSGWSQHRAFRHYWYCWECLPYGQSVEPKEPPKEKDRE